MARTAGDAKRTAAAERHRLDSRAVPPEGCLHARLYLVGEAPGRQEAELGRPFVGPAGEALREMIREAGIDASRVRLANAMPFRPFEQLPQGRSRNRRPTEQELGTYGGLVLDDIAKVQPSLVAALGRSAAALFGAQQPLEQARRQHFQLHGIPVRVTYHPAFVLRFGGRGSRLWRSTVRDLARFWSEALGTRAGTSKRRTDKGS